MLVRTTSASKDRRVKIRELGKVVGPGVKFEVTPERFTVLAGENKFHVRFVEPVEVPEVQHVESVKVPDTPKKVNVEVPKEEVKEETLVVEETPEIWVIEPGKEPVQVDESLAPIKEEEPVVEEAPKKKRGRKKKEEVVEGE